MAIGLLMILFYYWMITIFFRFRF